MKKTTYFVSFLALLFLSFLLGSCSRVSEGSNKAAEKIKLFVTATAQTEALKNPSPKDDAADDPAVWINPNDVENSRIIGTDKTGGLAVYNLDGKELFYYPDGRLNNVDIRYDFPLGEKKVALVAASNRSTKDITFYQVEETDGSLRKLPTVGFESPMKKNVYGFCLGVDTLTNTFYAYVNSKLGEVVQWKIQSEADTLKGEIVRTLKLSSKLEGMVADDTANTLFIGEEGKGIWKTTLTPNSSEVSMLADSDLKNNTMLEEDIEGLAIYRGGEGKNYLLASSQGNYSYAVFELVAPHRYIGSFRIKDGRVDAAEETDGIEAVSVALGEKYPQGIFVVQDGFNKDAKGKAIPQNFKIVDWRNIDSLIQNRMKK